MNNLSVKIFSGVKCNACCTYCDVAKDLTPDFNRFDEAEYLIKHLTIPISEIEIDGRESFEYPDILNWLRRFDYPVYIFTNGSLLSEDFVKEMPNNFNLRISLDGPKEVNDYQRKLKSGESAFDAAMRGIELLEKYNRSFIIGATITDFSIPYLNDIRNFFSKEIKARRFVLTTEVHSDLKHTKAIYDQAKPVIESWEDSRFELHSFHSGSEETNMKKELMLKQHKIQLNEIGFKTPILQEWSWENKDVALEAINENTRF